MDWIAFRVSMQLAICTTLILFVLGLPFAYWLANSRWRFKSLLEALITLPLVLPPTVIGFYLLTAFGPKGWLGQGTGAIFGWTLPFRFEGILLASVLCNVPFAIRPFQAAIEGIDRQWIEASWCLGQSRWKTFWRVIFPLAWPGILVGLVLTFAHALGEFGVVLMIGGNIPGVTRTLSIAIYDDVQALNYEAAHRTSLLLLAVAAFVLWVVQLKVPRRKST